MSWPDGCPPAPTDAAAAKAWERIATIARDHALILQAYGGVMTLVMPEEQRRYGKREMVLRVHLMRETRR